MPNTANSALTFTTGCAINRDMYYVACSPDAWRANEDMPYTVMCFYQHQTPEKWHYHELPDKTVVSVAYPAVPTGHLRKAYALSEFGVLECYSRESVVLENILDTSRGENANYMHRVRSIGSELYVCGTKGQIYKKGPSGWISFDTGLRQLDQKSDPLPPLNNPAALLSYFTASMKSTLDLVDINGRSDSAIYAVGNDGFIAHHDGVAWHQHKRSTSASLNAIHVENASHVTVVGAAGTILMGNDEKGFTVVSRKQLPTDFYSVTSYENNIYIGAGDGLYQIENGRATRLKISDTADLQQISNVESIEDVLWVLSEKKLLRYDGKHWEVFEHPNNTI
jgi:hypothetical protein